jgi:hypothetical protein
MALVTTTVTPELRLTPFTGISEVQRESSGIARAEAVYSAYGTWPATGAGDMRSISFAYSLDPDYGYVMMESNAAFIMYDDYSKMECAGAMEITTDLGPGGSQKETQWYPYINYASRQDGDGTTPIGDIPARRYNSLYPITGQNGILVFNLDPKPSALLYPFPGVNTIDVTSMFGEQALQEAAVAYRFYTRFLQYDIVQGYNYVVNSPIMTRG